MHNNFNDKEVWVEKVIRKEVYVIVDTSNWVVDKAR